MAITILGDYFEKKEREKILSRAPLAGMIGLDTQGNPVFISGLTPAQAIDYGARGREWATHFTRAGAPGTKVWLTAKSEERKWIEARRIASEKQARIKAELEAKKRQEEQARKERQQAIARADKGARHKAEQRIRKIKKEKTSLKIRGERVLKSEVVKGKRFLKKTKLIFKKIRKERVIPTEVKVLKIPKKEKIKKKFRQALSGLRRAIPRDLSLGTGQFIRDPETGKLKQVMIRDVTKKLFKNLEKKGFSKQRIAGFTTLSDKKIDELEGLSAKEKAGLKKISKLQREMVVGGLKEIEEKPENIIAIAALGRVSPGVIKSIGGSKTAVKIIKKIPPKVQKKGAKAIGRFLKGAYLASVGIRVVKEPTPELRAQRLGRILVGEVAPFEIGTKIGVKGLLKQELQNEINKAVKGMSKTRQHAFKDYMEQAQAFGKYEPTAKNIKLNNIESIPDPKAQKTVRNFLKGSKGNVIVGGSVAQTGQIKVTRKLGDVDLYIEKGSTHKLAKQLVKKLQKGGVKRVSSVKGKVTIAGKKAVEFHDIDMLNQNINAVTPLWSRTKSYIIKTPEGIRIQRIGLQARRKVVAAFADPKRLQTGKYRTDLKDFKKISDEIFKNAVKKSKGSYFFKKKKIKQIEKIFKRKIPKMKVKKVKPPKIKVKKIKKPTIKKPKVKIIKKPKLTSKQLKKMRLESLKKARAKLKLLKKKKPPKYPPKKRIPKKLPRVPYPPIRRPPKKPPKYPPKKPPRKPPKEPPRRPPEEPPKKPQYVPPKKIPRVPPPPVPPPEKVKERKRRKKALIISLARKRKIPKKPRLRIGYDVYGKRLKGRKIKGKKRKVVWIKLNTKPLTKTHAQNRGAYAIDHSVARTFKVKRVRKVKRVGKITKREGKYFKKTKKKYRPYKIKKGVKRPITKKYIERKGRYLIDTLGEKRGLKLHKIARQLKGRPVRRIKKRVIRRPIKKIRIKRRKSITTRFKKSNVLKKRVTLIPQKRRVMGGKGRISKSIKKPKRFVKGSKEAKEFMVKLRGMRR